MSFDINKWKKFLVTESLEPELLEEALEDRVPVSVAEEIREDVSVLSWNQRGQGPAQDVKGVEDFLANLFLAGVPPKKIDTPKDIILNVGNEISKTMKGAGDYSNYPLPTGKTMRMNTIHFLEYNKHLDMSFDQMLDELRAWRKIILSQRPVSFWDKAGKEIEADTEGMDYNYIKRETPAILKNLDMKIRQDPDNALKYRQEAQDLVGVGMEIGRSRAKNLLRDFKKLDITDFFDNIEQNTELTDFVENSEQIKEILFNLSEKDFRVADPTLRDFVNFVKPFDDAARADPSNSQKITRVFQMVCFLCSLLSLTQSRKCTLLYNYLSTKGSGGADPEVIDNFNKYVRNVLSFKEDDNELFFKDVNGMIKRAKKFVKKSSMGTDQKDALMSNLDVKMQLLAKQFYRDFIKISNRQTEVFQFLSARPSNWTQLKGMSYTQAFDYAKKSLANFEQEKRILFKYPDGAYWYNAGMMGCTDYDNEWQDKEFKIIAKRHANCGMDGAGEVITLRYKDQDGYIESDVMVSYFKGENRINQIKGSKPKAKEGEGNLCPDPKWWDYILDLINKLKVKKITEIGQYTVPDEQIKFPKLIRYLKDNAKHEVEIDPKFEMSRNIAVPQDAGDDDDLVFQERLIKNLNLKPKKKLSKHAQAKLEWYKRRRRR